MLVAIHQPNYLGYIGFFDKLRQADLFVIGDDFQFVKRDFHHRNKIRTNAGSCWLTVPVEKANVPIRDIRIRKSEERSTAPWNKHHLQVIESNYRAAPYFHDYFPLFKDIYDREYETLIDLNMDLIRAVAGIFEIKTEIIFASELGISTKATQRLIDICKELNGDAYLSGPQGPNHMIMELFEENDLGVVVQDFNHPVYPQRYDGFVSHLSILDFIMNCGTSRSLSEAPQSHDTEAVREADAESAKEAIVV